MVTYLNISKNYVPILVSSDKIMHTKTGCYGQNQTLRSCEILKSVLVVVLVVDFSCKTTAVSQSVSVVLIKSNKYVNSAQFSYIAVEYVMCTLIRK